MEHLKSVAMHSFEFDRHSLSATSMAISSALFMVFNTPIPYGLTRELRGALCRFLYIPEPVTSPRSGTSLQLPFVYVSSSGWNLSEVGCMMSLMSVLSVLKVVDQVSGAAV